MLRGAASMPHERPATVADGCRALADAAERAQGPALVRSIRPQTLRTALLRVAAEAERSYGARQGSGAGSTARLLWQLHRQQA